MTSLILGLTAYQQIYDTNFYSLWEATALLAGDHPYRDFYEWGVPLQAYVSAAAQIVVGYRLIGEFLVQWIFIVAGGMISFSLGLRLSRSVLASLVTASLSLVLLLTTPIFHYPKLFFYPLAVWLAWWYLERPNARRAAVFGAVTALAFLYRHDHGVYLGGLAVLTFAVTRLAIPASRDVRSSLRQAAAYSVVAIGILAPWAVVVHLNEGLPQYVESRAELYGFWSASQSPYRTLWALNPIAALTPDPLPEPRPGLVAFQWSFSVDEATQRQLEKRFALRLVEGPDEEGRMRYELPNLYDARLLQLRPLLNETEGFEWERLNESAWHIPGRARSQLWLQQVTLLIPLLLLASAALAAVRSRRRGEPVPLDIYRIAIGATFLAVIDSRLFRELSYAAIVAPLTAALSTPLLVRPAHAAPVWSRLRRAIGVVLVLVTAASALSYTRDSMLYSPFSLGDPVRSGFGYLLASPPIRGNSSAEPSAADIATLWAGPNADRGWVMMRYIHDCTREGDRVIVTGSTPYHIGYMVERPIAGGQLFWHHGWRRDPAREVQALELLRRQSVPFALSTHDPVLRDFEKYPRIREYLASNYTELDGSAGFLLIDKGRRPTGTFGTLGFPCFR